MPQQIFGLWIVPDEEAEKPRWKGDNRLVYNTHIGLFDRKQQGLFVTNPTFREWIQENQQWIGKQLGDIELLINEKGKQILVNWFYPFGQAKKIGKEEWFYPEEIFGAKGIGAFAFYRVLTEAKKLFPDFRTKMGTTPTTDMHEMLMKMGWKRPYKYPVSIATKLARDYVAGGMRKRRRK